MNTDILFICEVQNSCVIGSTAFYYCNALSTVYYSGTEEQWNAITINSGNDALSKANIVFGHEHNFSKTVISEATCSQSGLDELICKDCGFKKQKFRLRVLTNTK